MAGRRLVGRNFRPAQISGHRAMFCSSSILARLISGLTFRRRAGVILALLGRALLFGIVDGIRAEWVISLACQPGADGNFYFCRIGRPDDKKRRSPENDAATRIGRDDNLMRG